ncbi:putative tyrosine protein phosphatase MIH1 [Sugiyamaella lignohabitans]|uniref:M-phase inducer phosphatase n=1 Tax=Sugiyamaella lignohabitans TaxID=796027 RepID=A0A161HYS5_9ASCO|nr:putative tyrosine protein phosphatase MIH1 [Sugiyamaella lignohabitans]ANB15056.1 putative tyrosine protein phosphatase MIH1 [Sugiyamaella lignohabitans]
MIDLAFSPIASHRTGAVTANGSTSSKFEHAQMMSHSLQSLLFQGSPSRGQSPCRSSSDMIDSSPVSKSKQQPGLFSASLSASSSSRSSSSSSVHSFASSTSVTSSSSMSSMSSSSSSVSVSMSNTSSSSSTTTTTSITTSNNMGITSNSTSTRTGLNRNNSTPQLTISTKSTSTPCLISSPTTSALAADMSQNFHIDKTPSLPTPRRNLFQFPKANRSFALRRAATTTSATLSTIPSSPMSMDMDQDHDEHDSSPLPHKPVNTEMKPPASSLSQITNSTFALKPTVTPTSSVKPKPFAMARMKSLSNASFLINSKPQLIPIQHDLTPCGTKHSASPLSNTSISTPNLPGAINLPTTPTIPDSSPDTSINSLFAPSPVAQRIGRGQKCKSALYITRGAPATRDSFKAPRPGLTRNAKVRRTHSMFQHPEEFLSEELNEEKEVEQASIIASPIIDDDRQSFLAQENCSIATFTVKEDPFRRIGRETLCEILDGKYNNVYDRFLIIDCRFEYEYEGGHIDGAININSKDCLEESLLANVDTNKPNEKLLLIFHCEYSAHRGPRMAMHLRKCDRHLNQKNYPRLHYPDIVILQGGYSHFFEKNVDRCVPQRYVEMNDASHAQTCEREMGKFRRNMKFSRSQTYTFGSNSNSTGSITTTTINSSVNIDLGTPCANAVSGKRIDNMLSDFRFPLREQNMNTTPTGPPSRKAATKLASFNDFMDSPTSQPPQFNVCAQLRFA